MSMRTMGLPHLRITVAPVVEVATISIAPDNDNITLASTDSAAIVYTLTRGGGYTGTVTPAVTGLPAGVAGAWSDGSLTGADATTTLTLTSTAAADTGAIVFTVTFSGSGVSDAVDTGAVTVGSPTHYGTALLPTTTPTYTSSNSGGAGHTFSPTTPAELNTVLTGGSLGGFTLAAGDTIVLARGTCYNSGSYPTHRFGYISGAAADPIYVITSDFASIAAPDERILTSQRHATPHFRCQSNNQSAVLFDTTGVTTSSVRASKGWVFKGIQMDAGSVTSIYGIVRIGPITEAGTWLVGTTYDLGELVDGVYMSLQSSNTGHATSDASWWRRLTADDLADNITFDRCDIAATAWSNNCAIVVYNACKTLIFKGCHLYTEGRPGVEDKALASVDAAGPLLIENCQLTSSGIPALFGGSNPTFTTMVEDATIKKCWFYKPVHMLENHASWDGNARLSKNLFEIKTGRRFLIEDCLFENGFDDNLSQFYAIVFKVSNGSDSPGQAGFDAAETCDVTFRYNRLKNVHGCFGLAANDTFNLGPALTPCHDFSIYHNYTETPAGSLNNAAARNWFFQISSAGTNIPDSIHIEHNTLVGDHARVDIRAVMVAGSPAIRPTNLVWRNNVCDFGNVSYGGFNTDGLTYRGTDVFLGTGSDIQGSLMYTVGASIPAGKYNDPPIYRSTTAADIYVDRAGGDYATAAARSGDGYNGEVPGADITTIDTRTAGCAGGIW